MGLIKEPKNVDLIVNSKPWSQEEMDELSAIIKKSKSQKPGRLLKFQSHVQKALSISHPHK